MVDLFSGVSSYAPLRLYKTVLGGFVVRDQQETTSIPEEHGQIGYQGNL